MKTEKYPGILNAFTTHLLFLAWLIGLFFISRLDFVVFHLIVELYTIITSACIFIILWNSQRYLTKNYFIILSIGFLFSSLIDFLHALSYPGMPFFAGYTTNLPTQLWIAARYLQAITFVIAPIFPNRKIQIWLPLWIYSLLTLSLIFFIFKGFFPVCFIEGVGLSPFKIISEYIICFLFLIGGIELLFNPSKFEKVFTRMILGSLFFIVLSELVLTRYINVFGSYVLIGHLLRVIAYYLFSLTLVKEILENPFAVIFSELKGKESEIEDARSHYQTLFMEAPIRIFEEDFSLVKKETEKLRSEGVLDFKVYFDSHPNEASRFCGLTRILSWNKEAERYFPDLPWKINISLSELFPEKELVGISNEFIAVSKGLRFLSYETSSPSKTGQSVNKLISWAVVSGHEQDYSRVIVLVQDVSEIKQMAEKLRESEEKYRLLFDNAGIVIGCYDLKGNILSYNKMALEVMGGNIEDYVGKNVNKILDPDLSQQILERIKRTAQSGGGRQYEDLVDLPVSKKWFLSTYSQIKDSQSICTGVQVVSQDITDRKKLEEELRQYSNGLEVLVNERTKALEKVQAQLVSQEKLAVMGQMASGVGHELRNPLAVINNAVYVLKKTMKEQDDQTKNYLQIIGQEIGTADKIISDLLTFARIKPVDRKETSLPHLVDKVLERYFPPENVAVKLKLARDLLPVMIDAGQIEQVLINLITNAYQAMPEGGSLIISANQKKDKVSLIIEDSGIGIEEQNLERIFEPLFTTKAKGIGLGLTVTKLLTEANEGIIDVKSEVGKKTIFTITLPTK